MRDIARTVNLNPGSLYNHFSSKQVLYEAVLERGLRPMFDLLDGLAESEWTQEQLDSSMDAMMAHFARRPHMPRLLLHEALAGGEELTRIARGWLQPLYSRAVATFRDSGSRAIREDWEESELPLLISAAHYLILGHFAVAPMLKDVFGEDPLSPGGFERQTGFLRKILRLLLFGHTTGRKPEATTAKG
jgi:AcrR family transcriptional regulator